MATQPTFNSKSLFWVSAAVVFYFGFVYLNHYYFHIDLVLLGVFQELLLFPLMALQLVLLFFSLKNLIAAQFSLKTYSFPTVCILLISSVLTWGSFIIG
jgi:hypothetical protein